LYTRAKDPAPSRTPATATQDDNATHIRSHWPGHIINCQDRKKDTPAIQARAVKQLQ
jgi:hypothetical protein